jgi:hypothetical protein
MDMMSATFYSVPSAGHKANRLSFVAGYLFELLPVSLRQTPTITPGYERVNHFGLMIKQLKLLFKKASLLELKSLKNKPVASDQIRDNYLGGHFACKAYDPMIFNKIF